MSGFGYYLITCINITIYLNNILQQILLSSQLLLTISVKFVFFKKWNQSYWCSLNWSYDLVNFVKQKHTEVSFDVM